MGLPSCPLWERPWPRFRQQRRRGHGRSHGLAWALRGGSREPAVQHPASLLAHRGEGPGALSLRGLDDVIVATGVVAVPPAAFQALGAGNDARMPVAQGNRFFQQPRGARRTRSEEHTSELQSRENLVCRLLLEKKNA